MNGTHTVLANQVCECCLTIACAIEHRKRRPQRQHAQHARFYSSVPFVGTVRRVFGNLSLFFFRCIKHTHMHMHIQFIFFISIEKSFGVVVLSCFFFFVVAAAIAVQFSDLKSGIYINYIICKLSKAMCLSHISNHHNHRHHHHHHLHDLLFRSNMLLIKKNISNQQMKHMPHFEPLKTT